MVKVGFLLLVVACQVILTPAAAEEFGETPDPYDYTYGAPFPGVEPLVDKWFEEPDRAVFVAVSWCESRHQPYVDNRGLNRDGSIDYGLFQHNNRYWVDRVVAAGFPAWVSPLDPDVNVAVAAWLFYEGGGLRHWNASKACWG